MRARRIQCLAILASVLIGTGGALATTVPDGFEDSLVVEGLDTPTAMAFAPDGRIFVAQKGGQIRIVADGVLRPDPFVTVAVHTGVEHGLDGIVLDPAFAENRRLYVYYAPPTGTTNRLSRFTASATDPFVAEADSEVILIDGIPGSTGYHNGGSLHFGPDGMLYLGTGDSGVSSNGQNMGSLGGKVLRIDPAHYPDLVPADNPFVGTPGARGEIWAVGFRNPFTSAFDPSTGVFFVNDVGNVTAEEINDVRRGQNYGWGSVEGPSTNPAYTNPVYSYAHDAGAAITGGVFYRGNQFPSAYRGKYFFADYVRQIIQVLDPADYSASDFMTNGSPVLDLDVGPDGNLYVLVKSAGTYAFSNSQIHKIAYVGAANRAPVAVATADPTNGAWPLVVHFSAAGSSDPDGDPLTFSWDFGDGSDLGAGVAVDHVYATAGEFDAVLVVRDPFGGEALSEPIRITTDNAAPTAAIIAPVEGTHYRAGDTITFEGVGSDPEDGDLPAAACSWEVVFHHETHTHPFLGPLLGISGGSFTIPEIGETDPVQWYRIHLVVTDTGGLMASDEIDVTPLTAAVSLATNVPQLALTLDEQTVEPPLTFVGVQAAPRTIGAPLEQQVGAITYGFTSWSDGGEPTHTIATPEEDAAFTAFYAPIADYGDLGISSAQLRVSWRSHHAGKARDRLTVIGSADRGAVPPLLAARRLRATVNGTEIAAGPLNARGRYGWRDSAGHVDFRLSARTGRYRLAVTGLDLRPLLGVADVTEARQLPVGLTIAITDAPRPVLDGALPFGYRSRAGTTGIGRFPSSASSASSRAARR